MNAKSQAAMLSVYFHAHRKVGPKDLDDEFVWLRPVDIALLPSALQPIPIEQAARILAEAATDHHGETNRVRAVAQLAAARLHLRPEYYATFRLLGEDPRELAKIVPPNVAPDRTRDENTVRIELTGNRLRGCALRKKSGNATFDEKTLVTTAHARVEVQRNSPGELRWALEPIHWEACHSGMQATYVARRRGRVFPVDGAHNAERDPHQPVSGTAWERTLFEHFRIHWNLLTFSSFRNILNIRCIPGNHPVLHVDYSLARALRSRIYLDDCLGGLDRNDGYIKAAAVGGRWYRVDVGKALRFTSRGRGWVWGLTLNRLARWVLGTMLDDEVYNATCCEPKRIDQTVS